MSKEITYRLCNRSVYGTIGKGRMTSGLEEHTYNSHQEAGDTQMIKTQMKKAVAFIELFREIHPEFPPQMILAFLFIGWNEGCSMDDMAESLKISPSAAGRNAVKLCTKYNGRTGYGLVDIDVDPINTRIRRLHLSKKGEAFMKQITEVLE